MRIPPPRVLLLIIGALIASQVLQAAANAPASVAIAGPPVFFQDVAATSGINYSNESWGAAWGDFNGDGLPDIYTSNHKHPDSLWLNNGNGTFTDIGASVIPIPKTYIDTHGSTWADVENRGVQDLIEVTDSGSLWPSPDFFLHNTGTTFVDQASARGLQFNFSRSRQSTWLDFNNDGRLDLFEPTLRRGDNSDLPSAFFQQNADGTFTNVTTAVACKCSSPLQYLQLADIAGRANGRPQMMIGGDLATGFPQSVYDMSTVPFTDIRAQLGIPMTPHVFDSAIGDFTNSGRNDIFTVAGFDPNDVYLYDPKVIHARLEPSGNETGFSFQTSGNATWKLFPNFLVLKLTMSRVFIGSTGYHPTVANPSNPVFTLSPTDPNNVGIFPHTAGTDEGLYIGYDPTTQTWTTDYSLKGRHGSVEGDGGNYLTFYTSATTPLANVRSINFTPNRGYPNRLLMNTGSGFTDQTTAAGVTGSSYGSVVTGDFNNDGYLDIFAAGTRGSGQLPNVLYMNNGDGTFTAIPNAGGALHTTVGHGDQVAMADYNNDGCLDIFETNGRKPIPFFGPYQLFRNVCNSGNHWIELHLQGTTSNRDGVGAHVVLQAGSLNEMRDQDNGVHGRAQNSQVIHFGLALNTTIANITIDWPSGIQQVLTNVPADQLMTVVEPAALAGTVVTQDYRNQKPATTSRAQAAQAAPIAPGQSAGSVPAPNGNAIQAALAARLAASQPSDVVTVSVDPLNQVDVGIQLSTNLTPRAALVRAARDILLAAATVFKQYPHADAVMVTISQVVKDANGKPSLAGVIAVKVGLGTTTRWAFSSLMAGVVTNPSAVLCASDAYLIQQPAWKSLSARDRGCLTSADRSFDEDN